MVPRLSRFLKHGFLAIHGSSGSMRQHGDYNSFRNILKIPSALMALKWNALSKLQRQTIFLFRSDILKSRAVANISRKY